MRIHSRVLPVVVLATTALLGGAPVASAGTSHQVAQSDNHKDTRPISIHLHDVLNFTTTQCDGSCGDSWEQTKAPSKAVAKAGKVTTTTGRDAYHHRIFSYSAVAVGKTTIKLGFFEPGRNQPGRTITITLTVLQ